jgi:alpha-L-rhamnosidase
MKPTSIEGLDFVKASHISPYGKINSEWVKTADHFDWQITIPPNTTATVYLPAGEDPEVLEGDRPYRLLEGGPEDGAIAIPLVSGSYHFISKL